MLMRLDAIKNVAALVGIGPKMLIVRTAIGGQPPPLGGTQASWGGGQIWLL